MINLLVNIKNKFQWSLFIIFQANFLTIKVKKVQNDMH